MSGLTRAGAAMFHSVASATGARTGGARREAHADGEDAECVHGEVIVEDARPAVVVREDRWASVPRLTASSGQLASRMTVEGTTLHSALASPDS